METNAQNFPSAGVNIKSVEQIKDGIKIVLWTCYLTFRQDCIDYLEHIKLLNFDEK